MPVVSLEAGWLGLEKAREIFVLPQLEISLKGRWLIADLLDIAVTAAYWRVLDLFFLVALRVLLRSWWPAAAVFVLCNGTLETLEGIHPAVSWLTLGVGIAGGTALLPVRYGVVSYAAALFCYLALITAPITLDFSAWYAETGLFVLALVAAVGGFGFWSALAGRPFLPSLVEAESRAAGGSGASPPEPF